MNFLDIFTEPFLLRALIAALLIAGTSAILGVFLLLKRFSLVGEGLAHFSFLAIALALILGIYPFYFTLLFSILGVFLISFLEKKVKIYSDAAIGAVASLGIALGVIIVSASKGFNASIYSYLFGNLLSVAWSEIYFLILLSLGFTVFIIINYRALFAWAFDEDSSVASGVRINRLNNIFLIFTALIIASAIKAVGVILVSALLIIPASTALQGSSSFKGTIVKSFLFSIISVLLGLSISLLSASPPGASIVLSSFTLLFLNYFLKI